MTDEQLNSKIQDITGGEASYISGYTSRYSKIKCLCNIHNSEFEVIFDTIMHRTEKNCCCPKCKADRLNQKKLPRHKVICDYCGKEFEKVYPRKGFNFCCRECKDNAQKIESGEKFKSLRPKHYGTGECVYREKAFKEYPHKCAVCG